MTPQRRREIEELYYAARERGREALAGLAPDLRREVERLLDEDSGAKTLDQSAGKLLADSGAVPWATGMHVGPYRIEAPLGAGGMGDVYRATDTRLGRAVAIKTCRDRFSERFHREARAISSLNHPHVCILYDVGPDYLVMELVEGETLAARLKRGRLPIGQTLRYGSQIADALHSAHAKGIVHRDLKPGNIMLGKSGVKVLDFGLAKSPGDEAVTATHIVIGTPAYMAPEQLAGKPCGPFSDIYALGLVLREMATGSRKGNTQELPEYLAHVIERCLREDPEERWQTALDVSKELAWAAGSASTDSSGMTTQPLNRTETARRSVQWLEARSRLWRWLIVSVSVFVLAAAALLWAIFRPRPPGSIAVLPFENRTGDPEMEYVSQGITESLITDLSRIPTLRVSALGSVLVYVSSKFDAQTAGSRLNVARIVRGSVSRMGDELRIEAELMDVRSGNHLWSRWYTAKVSSLSDAFERFSTEITDQLRLKLSGPLKNRLALQYAAGSESYRSYLQGRLHLSKRTPEGFDTAIRHFDQVIAKNAEYAPAYAGLAYTYAQMALHDSQFGTASPAHALEKARTAALRALELDGTLAEAYTALAFVQMQADYQWESAEKTFSRAIELNPNWADARECYALELAALGRFGESMREIRLAEALEPDTWALKGAHATILYYARSYNESLSIIEEIARDPRVWTMGDLAAPVYWAKLMPSEALAALLRLPQTFTPHIRTPLLAAAYARVNERNKAKKLLDSYPVRAETAAWYYLALAHLSLGDRLEALRDLERDYDRRSAEILLIAVDPMMDDLRAEPRFRTLLARMKLNPWR